MNAFLLLQEWTSPTINCSKKYPLKEAAASEAYRMCIYYIWQIVIPWSHQNTGRLCICIKTIGRKVTPFQLRTSCIFSCWISHQNSGQKPLLYWKRFLLFFKCWQWRSLYGFLFERLPCWISQHNVEVRRGWEWSQTYQKDDWQLSLMLHHRWPWPTRFLDSTVWLLCHGHASHTTSTQRKGLRQSPGELPGPKTPCPGLSSVLLCWGGEHSVLQALQEPGLCWRSVIQGCLVGMQLLRMQHHAMHLSIALLESPRSYHI